MIGHNHPTFDDIVKDNLRGLLLAIKETIITAIHDPRLDRRHLRVLALVVDHINAVDGMAYPGRKKLASDSGTYGRDPYTPGTIAVTIAELVQWGYLVSDKRGPKGGGRALSHYTIRRPSTEDLQAEITAWVRLQTAARADAGEREPWRKKSADVNDGVNVRNDVQNSPDVNPSLNVSHSDVNPSLNVKNPDVNPVVLADVNPVVSTVTRIGTRSKTPQDLFDEIEQDQQPDDADASGVRGSPEFEAFWDAYPKKIGKAKALATFVDITKGKHKSIDKTAAGKIIRGAKGFAYNAEQEKVERRYIPNPQTWLNRAGWLDDNAQPPEETPKRWWENREKVAKLTLEDWARGIDKYCGTFWDAERMGPPPGEPGCVVSEFFIRKLGLREIFDHRGLRRK